MPERTPSRPPPLHSRLSETRWHRLAAQLLRAEVVTLTLGVLAVLTHIGVIGNSSERVSEVSWVVLLAMTLVVVSRTVRLCTVASGSAISRLWNGGMILPIVWLVGIAVIELQSTGDVHAKTSVWSIDIFWTETVVSMMGVVSLLTACRLLAARTHNSAVLLAGSFLVVIGVGTLLLMLPGCRANGEGAENLSADWHVAVFTATSASCVTGLIVEPTGSYWSPMGHAVIFGLFQVGGLGILTFGAFIAILSGRQGLQIREARTLREMLDADTVQDSRRLLLTILLFTVAVEALGAFSLMGLWPDRPFNQQVWFAVFHSVSAFCNAGFSLQDEGFLGMGSLWQVWGPLSMLIILGGLGFPVVHDLWSYVVGKFRSRPRRAIFLDTSAANRLSLNSRLVLWTTLALLAGGALFWFVLESLQPVSNSTWKTRVADSWFQSVTFRTAGFNTVDHGAMNPATKLLAIFLMFIGAAPGSTGGGVKTVVFALTLLNIWAVSRGRDRVEVFGRSIPTTQVSRALSMIAIGLFVVMGTTGLLVIFERQPERFLDHLYEATSAFATVGVSTGITADLSLPSRLLICIVMFLGRIGPVTLLLAMAAQKETCRYEYPVERVNLG